VKLEHISEDALLITLASAIDDALPGQISRMIAVLRSASPAWLTDLIPSYTTLLIVYDPVQASFRDVEAFLRKQLVDAGAGLNPSRPDSNRLIELPVYYSPESGPDLEALAGYAGLDTESVIRMHSSREYRVHALGFAPGFAFMGQVDQAIACPRKASPRKQVPAGSVGIADRQTAVYPGESPGGWQLIGRCPTRLFDAVNLSLLQVGDRVSFHSISRDEFLALGGIL